MDQQPDELSDGDAPALPTEEPTTDTEAELSGLRIRQIAALRRGAYRARSYCIVAFVALLVAGIKLIILTARHVHHDGWGWRPIAYSVVAVVALATAVHFAGKIAEITRELSQPIQTDPATPPDFSTLSDGSQHARNLEEIY
jgi:hypothetical protein